MSKVRVGQPWVEDLDFEDTHCLPIIFLDENYNLEKVLVLVSYMTYSIVTRKPQTECYYVEIQDLEHGENLYKGWYLNTVLMNSIVRLLWKKQRRFVCIESISESEECVYEFEGHNNIEYKMRMYAKDYWLEKGAKDAV